MIADPALPIGKVVKVHGLKGHVKILPYGETLGTLVTGEIITALLPDGRAQRLTTVDIKPHQKAFLFLSREINSVDQARDMVGAEICVPESRLSPTAPNEFYWYQLIGLEVVNLDGRKLGKIEDIIQTGSNDVYVVRQGSDETLIPAIHTVVREVNLQRRLMTVELPESM